MEIKMVFDPNKIKMKFEVEFRKEKFTKFAAAAATAAAICCFWASAKIWTILWCVAGSVCLVLTAGYGLSFEPLNKI